MGYCTLELTLHTSAFYHRVGNSSQSLTIWLLDVTNVPEIKTNLFYKLYKISYVDSISLYWFNYQIGLDWIEKKKFKKNLSTTNFFSIPSYLLWIAPLQFFADVCGISTRLSYYIVSALRIRIFSNIFCQPDYPTHQRPLTK